MSVFNSDSTTGLMCGNGIRCVAAYLFEFKHTGWSFIIDTDSGEKQVYLAKEPNKLYSVDINMGKM